MESYTLNKNSIKLRKRKTQKIQRNKLFQVIINFNEVHWLLSIMSVPLQKQALIQPTLLDICQNVEISKLNTVMMLNFFWHKWSLMMMTLKNKDKWSSDWLIFTIINLMKDQKGKNLSLQEVFLIWKNKQDWRKIGQNKKNKFTIWWKFLLDLAQPNNMNNLYKESFDKNKSDKELSNWKNLKEKERRH